jgi:hypothetical protein
MNVIKMDQACVVHVRVPLQYRHIHDPFRMMEMTFAICHPFKHLSRITMVAIPQTSPQIMHFNVPKIN